MSSCCDIPNQLGDFFVSGSGGGGGGGGGFIGFSTLSTFVFVQNANNLEAWTTNNFSTPLQLITATPINTFPVIASNTSKTQHIVIDPVNTRLSSDLDLANNGIIQVSNISTQTATLSGSVLSATGNTLLINGSPTDANWYSNAIPSGGSISFLSSNIGSPSNTLYTPDGSNLYYNATNLTGGGGGGSPSNWAQFPANSNVNVSYVYDLNVGLDAPTSTFGDINLCGNTFIGRQSVIVGNSPDVSIYPENFTIGDAIYPARTINLNSLLETEIGADTDIALNALVDISLTAGGLVAIEAVGDVNMLSANITAEAGEITMIGATLVDVIAPDINLVGAVGTTITGGLTTINSADVNITSAGLLTLTGSATALTTAGLNVVSGVSVWNAGTLAVNTIAGGMSLTQVGGGLIVGNTGNGGTTINGDTTIINSVFPIQLNQETIVQSNQPLRTSILTDTGSGLTIAGSNPLSDSITLQNIGSLSSSNGTTMTNITSITGKGGLLPLTIGTLGASQDLVLDTNRYCYVTASQFQTQVSTIQNYAELGIFNATPLFTIQASNIFIPSYASFNGSYIQNVSTTTGNIASYNNINISSATIGYADINNLVFSSTILNGLSASNTTLNGTTTINDSLTITAPTSFSQNVDLLGSATINASGGASFPLKYVNATYNNTPTLFSVSGTNPCYRLYLPITNLPTPNIYQLTIRISIFMAGNANLPVIPLNTSPQSKWYWRMYVPQNPNGAYPNAYDAELNLCGDIVNEFITPVFDNSIFQPPSYFEPITLDISKSYTIIGQPQFDVYWDLYDFIANINLNAIQVSAYVDCVILG